MIIIGNFHSFRMINLIGCRHRNFVYYTYQTRSLIFIIILYEFTNLINYRNNKKAPGALVLRELNINYYHPCYYNIPILAT